MKLENNCLAIIVKVERAGLRYGEVVQCVQLVPVGSVVNNGRLGLQVAFSNDCWWVRNKHGDFLIGANCLVRLFGDDDSNEVITTNGKPPRLGSSV